MADPRYRALDTTRWTLRSTAAGLAAYCSGEPLRSGTGTQLLAHSALVEDRRDVARP